MPFEGGPYLAAAILCEKILVEADGVKSAIRIIDRINHTVVGPDPPKAMEAFDYQLNLLLKFKSGMARGPMSLEVRFMKPSGESPSPTRQTVNFEGEDDRGVDIIANLQLKLDQAGLHWFDISLEGERVTRVPLRVVYLSQVRQVTAPPEGPSPG